MTITVVPANEASWDDIQTVFGRNYISRCQCQWPRCGDREFTAMPVEERARRLRDQTDCGHPDSDTTSGIVAYLGDEPVGWCSVDRRTAYPRLRTSRLVWAGRAEDRDDDSVWAVMCLAVRLGYRHRGVSRALAGGAVDHARRRGARAIEAYPLVLRPGGEITWDEIRVGVPSIFAAAGFAEITRPSPRRVVMRRDV